MTTKIVGSKPVLKYYPGRDIWISHLPGWASAHDQCGKTADEAHRKLRQHFWFAMGILLPTAEKS
jgi:hypothetical protein